MSITRCLMAQCVPSVSVSELTHSDVFGATLIRRMKAIHQPCMRTVVLAERLRDEDTSATVDMLAQLVSRAVRHGDPGAVMVITCLIHTLNAPEQVPYPVRSELYALAKTRGHDELARLFFDASPAEPGAQSRDDPMAPERPVMPRGRSLTLGERKALARTHRRDILEHIVRDPHPDVVAVLLGNPHLTERDVVGLAARRPALPAMLAVIAASQRWSPRYTVKRALVMNPYTPVHLAIRLATILRSHDLRAVAAAENLPTLLRQQAKGLIDEPG